MALSGQGWRKSSRCDTNACVEVAELSNGVGVRDSKELNGPVLTFEPAAWTAFVGGLSRQVPNEQIA